MAESHGWSFDGVTVLEATPPENAVEADEQYTVFHPSEVELNETTKIVLEEIERVKPARLVFDSITGLRLLAQTNVRFRQQLLSLKRAVARRGCTTFLVDDDGSQTRDLQVRSIVHGIVSLERVVMRYGAERRRLEVAKLRGVRYRGGYHDFAIKTGGIDVYPRIVTAEHRRAFSPEEVSSGLAGLDRLLGGGLTRGTNTLILGPSGVGKSCVATQYAVAAAARGEHSVIYSFDETLETYFLRSAGLGLDVRAHVEAGRIEMHQVDPAEMSQGEFAHGLRQAVEESQARVVVLDSLNGYLNSLPDKDLLHYPDARTAHLPRISGGFLHCWSWRSTGWSVKAWSRPRRSVIWPTRCCSCATSRWPEKCAGRFPQSRSARARTSKPSGNFTWRAAESSSATSSANFRGC